MGDETVISGISGRYPESATIDQFWNNLLSGQELYKESDARWPKGFMETPPTSGLIPGIEKFDAQFFGMPDSIANEMDPQFRMLHEVTYEALLDAGLDPFNVGQRTGMFIGYCEHATLQAKAESAIYDDVYGVVEDFTSVSQTFGFNGPVMTFDSACASAFSALNEAFHAIKCNIIDMAVVSGVTIAMRPRVANGFRRMGMTSPDGHCYCLDKRAKGYVRAESVSTIILQRQSAANRCYATVVNVRSNSDGYKVEGITFPGLKTQIKLMKETYEDANLDPKHVKYIEAHVTGTQAGDYVECGAIEAVFCPEDRTDPVLVGCLKSNVGHAEGASGTVALSKACMIMQRKLIPSNINYKDPNLSIKSIVSGKIKPVTEVTKFDGGIISLDSFGFGGCNIHTILKSFEDQVNRDDNVHNLSGFFGINRLILFKARNESSFKHLKRMIEQKPDQITTEFLSLVNNVAFLKPHPINGPNKGDDGLKMMYRGYFILDGKDKTINEWDWSCLDGTDRHAYDHGYVQDNLKAISRNHQPNLFLNNTFLTKLGRCYMECPQSESLIDMNLLYPKVKYPVSSGTASISPLIEWNHGQDWKVYSVPRNFHTSALRQIIILEYGLEYSYLRGHVIDGRIIVPATTYLQAVWHAIAGEMIYASTVIFLKTGIRFWNVKFNQAIILTDRNQVVKFFVHANTTTGYFEVVHEESVIVTGHAQLTYDEPVPGAPSQVEGHESGDGECLKRGDFYKELRIRGYDYCDVFQGVEECKIDGTGGKVSFLRNWAPFADAVLQLSLINDPSRSLIVPTGIECLQIDPSQFRHIPTLEREHMFDMDQSIALATESARKKEEEELKKEQEDGGNGDGGQAEIIDFEAVTIGKEKKEEEEEVKKEEYVAPIFNVSICKETKEIFTNAGLYIKSIGGTPIVRKKASPTLLKYSFRPFDECYDYPVNHEKNEEYEKECLKTLNVILDGKCVEMNHENVEKCGEGTEMKKQSKYDEENDGRYSLLRKLKEYQDKKVRNDDHDENMNPVSLLEYLRKKSNHEQESIKNDDDSAETRANCDLSMDTLTDVPFNDGDYGTFHQLALIGESSAMNKNQIVEINISSRCSLGHYVTKFSILLGPGIQQIYVDEETIRDKIKKDDDHGNNQDGGNGGKNDSSSPELETYLKGIINQNTKLVIFQHPSLGLTFMDTDMCVRDRIDAFKKGLKGVHDHASNGLFGMIVFRTEPLDIESKILSAFKVKSNEALIFEPIETMTMLITSVGWTIISTKVIGNYVSILAKKVDCDMKNVTTFEIDNFNYGWVDEINGKIYKTVATDTEDGNVLEKGGSNEKEEKKPVNEAPIYVITRGTGLTGINGLARCVHKEDKRIRGIHIETRQGQEGISNYNDILETCIKYDLLATYYKNGAFGSCVLNQGIDELDAGRGINLNSSKQNENLIGDQRAVEEGSGFLTTNCLDIATKGDLSSLKYYKIKLPVNRANDGSRIIDVHYSALNFKDVMVASGRVPLTAYPASLSSRAAGGGDLGMEFSGVDTTTGSRIMCLTTRDAIANKVVIGKSSDIVFDVPDHMSLDEAATIPVVYATVYYALILRGKLLPGESILIHAGSGGVGQAAINVCQSMGCEIFTTVGTDEKRQFIKSQFNIPDDHIFNSRNVSFADDLLRATNGRGVDMVLNSLSDEKLRSGLTCLADSGRFIEIGKYDMVTNAPFDPSILTRNQSFQSVCLAWLTNKISTFNGSGKCPEQVQLEKLMNQGLKDGIVKPFRRTIFGMDQAEEAFRFMATGKHIGKVLIDMNQAHVVKDCNKLDSQPVDKDAGQCTSFANPKLRVSFDGDKSYVVIGGLGGMGLEVCNWMVLKGVRSLIITSRSGIKTDFQKYCIDRMKNDFNCNIQISNLDIAKYQEAEELLKYCNSIGPLGGIFHLAMVLSEALFADQSTESFEKCCPIKVHGGHNLDQITRKSYQKLDHFVVFSSVAATLGNIGQTNYGLANCFLDDLCAKRRADGFNALSIAWGLVGDVGWVADNMVGVTNLAGTSIQRINSCLDVMEQVLYGNNSNIVSFIPSDGAANVGKSTNLAEVIFNILGIKDPSKLDPKTTLGELGLDSLMAIEMKQVLEKETGNVYSVKEIRATTVQDVDRFGSKTKKK